MDTQTPEGRKAKVFYSEEDESYIALVPDVDYLKYVSAFGDTEQDALKELDIVVNGCLEIREEQVKQRAERAEAALRALVGALKVARREHLIVEEDCWYSCPESGQCCDDTKRGCDCGAATVNATIDKALAQASTIAALPATPKPTAQEPAD